MKKNGMNPGPMKSLTPSKGGVKAPMEKSATVHVPVGSGSRPTKSKHMIPVSAPAHPRKLGTRGTGTKHLG